MRGGAVFAACVLALVMAGMAVAHDGEDHAKGKAGSVASPGVAAALNDAPTALPWQVGGAFELVDHHGQTRTQVDPEGRPQLLFFGYANCPGICSAALPLLDEAVAQLEADGITTQALLVTIDPKLDTVDSMGPALGKVSDRILGLTGSEQALSVAHKAFNVEVKHLFDDPDYGAIYSHGSFIYLLDGQGRVLTQVPPVLPPDQISAIVRKYIDG